MLLTDYLSTEFGLKDVEVKFTDPYDDFYKYGVVIYSSMNTRYGLSDKT